MIKMKTSYSLPSSCKACPQETVQVWIKSWVDVSKQRSSNRQIFTNVALKIKNLMLRCKARCSYEKRK